MYFFSCTPSVAYGECTSSPSKADAYPFTRSLIKSNMAVWRQYVQHTFVKQLGAGTLPKENFLHFVKYVKNLSYAYCIAVLTKW